MKISSRGRYALRLMLDLVENGGDSWSTLRDISARQGLSVKYLEQIVPSLSKSGLLLSVRGPQGGYKLSRKPQEYTIGDILRAIEGNLAPIACLSTEVNDCEHADTCATLQFWKGLHNVVNEYVDSVTLDDLAHAATSGNPIESSYKI